jgi:RNA polymerase sigma-70 factor (ECF subfamily)
MIKNNQQNVKNIIRLITKEENEDLEQEVYVKVWKNSENYTEQGTFKSWVNTIAKNVSKDYLKSAQKKAQDNSTSDELIVNTIRDTKTAPELRLIQNDRQIQIISAINTLKPKFKEVILLCEIEGYSYEQCAKMLKCPVGTVKSRLYNAKKYLAELLKELM